MASEPTEAETLPVLAVQQLAVDMGLLKAQTPAELVSAATSVAKALAPVITDLRLYVDIRGRRHVMVEGWTTLLAMLGILPEEESNIRQEDGSYVACVRLVRASDGACRGRASASCGEAEDGEWPKRSPNARRSMAATRATGKAARMGFSWIIRLAGYEPTPAEEMIAHTEAEKEEGPVFAVPFGKNKGKSVTELSDASVQWYLDEADKNLKLEKPRHRPYNEAAWADLCLAELTRRTNERMKSIPPTPIPLRPPMPELEPDGKRTVPSMASTFGKGHAMPEAAADDDEIPF